VLLQVLTLSNLLKHARKRLTTTVSPAATSATSLLLRTTRIVGEAPRAATPHAALPVVFCYGGRLQSWAAAVKSVWAVRVANLRSSPYRKTQHQPLWGQAGTTRSGLSLVKTPDIVLLALAVLECQKRSGHLGSCDPEAAMTAAGTPAVTVHQAQARWPKLCQTALCWSPGVRPFRGCYLPFTSNHEQEHKADLARG
jgi:hypothetical protein